MKKTVLVLFGLLLLGPPPVARAQGQGRPQLVVQAGHSYAVQAVALSPDGKYLVTGSKDGTAKLWELATGREIRTYIGHGRELKSLAMGPEGKRFVTGSIDKTAKLWDLATGEELRTFKGHTDRIRCLAISSDGKRLATGSEDKTVKLWDLATGREIRTFRGHGDWVLSAAMDRGGERLFSLDRTHTAKVWDLATGEEIRTLKVPGDRVWDHSFLSADGEYIVTGKAVWDVSSGKEIRTLGGQVGGRLTSVAFTPDGKLLVTGSAGGDRAQLWDLATGREVRAFKGHAGWVNAVAISRDGKRLVTGSEDNTAKLWDLATGEEIRAFEGRAHMTGNVAAGPKGRYLAVVSSFTVRLWDLVAGREARVLGGEKFLWEMAFCPDGKRLVTGSSEGAKLWDLSTGKEIRTFRGHPGGVERVAVSPDGKLLATGGGVVGDITTKLWDLATGRELRTFREAKYFVWALAFSPDGKNLWIGNAGGDVRGWDAATGERIGTLHGHPDHVTSLVFTTDGKGLLTMSDGGAILWDPVTGRKLRVLGKGPVAVSPDGSHAITGIRLRDLATGREIRIFKGHAGATNSVAFTRDGRHVVTTSVDGTAKLWEQASGRELCSLISLDGGWVVVAPDGRFDGSPEGLRAIRWTVGLDSYPLEAFSEGYYVPGLLARLLAGEKIAAGKGAGLDKGFALPPTVAITSPKDGAVVKDETVEVGVTAVDRGGGIDEIRLFHNGKAVGTDTRGIAVKGRGGKRRQTFRVALLEGENRLRAVALSKDRIEGNPVEIVVRLKAPQREAALHVLAVGINRYKNPALDLNYAEPDAKGLIDFFAKAPKRLFSSVNRYEIYDKAATKAGIVAKLKELEKTRPQDVVVIYLAGHGESVSGTWHFMPHEVVYPEEESEVRAKGLSSEQLRELVGRVPARKVLLLMDACKSGGALLAFRTRGFDERRALKLLARAAGVHMIMASTEDQTAAEIRDLGHGVFTYALLEALKGEADRNPKDGVVTVLELVSHVKERLPELSEKHKTQAQYPVMNLAGMDFPVAAR